MEKDFWKVPLQHVLQTLQATPEGLTGQEAQRRLRVYGENTVSTSKKRSIFVQFLMKFQNPLIILLLFAAVLAAFWGQKNDFFIILSMVILSVTLDFIQEYRANNAAEKLRESVALQTTVIREGIKKEIDIKYLVPGDVVFLSAGDLVPADGRILEQNHLYVNQSILTGESFPVEKDERDLSATPKDLGSAVNSLFMGTSVLTGDGKMVVCITGKETSFGEISESLSQTPPPTPFEIGTKKFGYLLMRLTFFLALFVVLINLLFLRPWFETVLFALALAVGMTPEFLPMVVSVTLARGAKQLAKKKVIVKRLSAIHDLGSMNVLCTDKTGTLTEAKIKLARHVDCNGEENEQVLKFAYLNSFFETGIKSPLDAAILQHETIDVKDWTKIDEIPYDFERRRVSVLLENKGERFLCVKGAPEDILSISTQYEDSSDGKVKDLTPVKRAELTELYKDFSSQGFRILGIAWCGVEKKHEKAMLRDEKRLIFSGFAVFYDPLKADVKQTIEKLNKAHVALKIVTGDNEDVTLHLCRELNLPMTGLLMGSEINTLSEEAFRLRVATANLFCRVTPSQKKRIISSLKEQGNIVGYLGDGINDAPSLQNADIGISVENAADVARAAADLILLDRDLSAVYEGVIEGRKTFANIMKYIRMMTSSNFGNMFSMAGATLIIPFLPMLPVQILLNNFMYDISETAIPLDNVDPELLETPRKWEMKSIISFMLLMGPLSSIFDFLTFFVMLKVFQAQEALFQTGWFVESLTTQILIIFVIRTRRSFFKSRANRVLTILSLSLVTLGAIIPFTQLGRDFGFVELPFYFYAVLFLLVIFYLGAGEIAKQWYYKKYPAY